ncbi:MAG TPA: DEAD/DEAH box helicase [Streptosporangiaceae bacterium]
MRRPAAELAGRRAGALTMRVIHGVWAYGALWLWAEDSVLPARRPAQPGHPAAAPRPHPFACQPAELSAELGELTGPAADLAGQAPAGDLTLWLPSAGGGPLSSPELIRVPLAGDDPRSAEPGGPGPGRHQGGRTGLAPWQVPALIFGPAAALELLLSVTGADPTGTIPAAGSVRYLAALAALAADLAGRGRVLPVLATEDGGWAARWRAVLAGPDAQRAGELAAAMPASCRATTQVGEPPAGLVTAVLDALADAAVRVTLRGLALPGGGTAARSRPAPAERWLTALTAADARLAGPGDQDEPETAELAGELAAWHAAAQAPAGPVRTCFRLREPAPDSGDDSWQVEFALQASDDPSLMLTAADIWAGQAGWAAGGIRHPEEELLSGLGRASRLFPELDAELRGREPAAAALDTAGALHFLRQTAPLLSGAEFGVLLPDWVRKARLGLRLTTRTRAAAAGQAAATGPLFGMQDLVDFRYELAVGDQVIDPDDLAELARLKVPLVRVRGQWVELDEAHLQAALRFLERQPSGSMQASEALQAGLQGADDLPVVQVDADGWLGDLLSGEAERRLAAIPAPADFRGKLRPYQERGLAWMAFLSSIGVGGVLADSMGLGKTIQLLALLAYERQPGDGRAPAPTLLVCPMSLVGNWEQEAAAFTPQLRVHVHHGAGRLSGEQLAAALDDADLVITTYAIAARDRAELAGLHWARVVCDEAQNIKNSAARQAQAVRALPARSRLALTGTPVENRLSDLWSILEFSNPGLLGSAEKFRTRFAVPIERHADEEAARQLRRLTGPFILRRLKTDTSIISDLPDKQEIKVWCNLTAEQASLYQATVTDMLARIEAADDTIQRRGLVLATMARLKQACNHPAHLLGDGSRLAGRSGKLARLEAICDEIVAEGDKALCFTQYAEFGSMLQPYLAARLGCPVLYLHGGTPKRQRDAMVAQFRSQDGPCLFLLSLKAGGTGLNLTAANHVLHVDRWWNPAVEEQATDRAFRIGQTRDVQVRKFICVGTLEERIDQLIEDKKALAETVVGSGESWLAELSVAELHDVISLSAAAVSE